MAGVPSSSRGGAAVVASATVTLGNAAILSLPTTPVTVVAAPGAGATLVFLQAQVTMRGPAGIPVAYVNVSAGSVIFFALAGAGGDVLASSNIPNAQDVINPNEDATAIVAAATADLTISQPLANVVNVPIQIHAPNDAQGVFTGGAAGNTLAATVYYAVTAAP